MLPWLVVCLIGCYIRNGQALVRMCLTIRWGQQEGRASRPRCDREQRTHAKATGSNSYREVAPKALPNKLTIKVFVAGEYYIIIYSFSI